MADSSTSADDNLIASLKEQPFCKRSRAQQIRVIHNGRPKPVLEKFFMQGAKGTMTQRNLGFREGLCAFMYQNYPWLAGEKNTEKLYCWPCLLTSNGNERNIWVDGADFDLDSLAVGAEVHSSNGGHLDNVSKVTVLAEELDAALLASFKTKHPLLDKNAVNKRDLLRKLVEAAIVVYTLDLSVEYLATDWVNAEKFQALFNLVAGGNEDLIKHCRDMGNDFIKMIRSFYHDFLECLQDKIHILGLLEIVQTQPQPLCSVQVDGIRDVDAGKNPLVSLMLGYVNDVGVYKQHFFGFESNTERSAAHVSRHVETAMDRYRDNAVSQSYDGACVFVNELTSLAKKIRTIAPGAALVPSVDHPLNTVLMQGVSNVRGVQLFVATIQDLIQNPKQLKVLSQLMNPDAANVAQPDWTVDSKFLAFLLDERDRIVSAFESPPANVCLSVEMAVKMKRLVNNLQDLTFVFLLIAFVDVLTITDGLADVLGRGLSDVGKCVNAVTLTVNKLRLLKRNIKAADYLRQANKICSPAKNPKANKNTGLFVTIFHLAIDNITLNLQSRFRDVEQFEFLQLTESEKFVGFAEMFPEKAFISLDKLYGNYFNIKRLEKELKCFIYCNPRFHSLSAIEIVKLIHDMGLKNTIPQTYRLFCLVVTLPITPIPGRDCFRQIQSFMCQARLHNYEKYENHRSLPTKGLTSVLIKHAQVVIEKPLVLTLFAQEGFRETLIEEYVVMKKGGGINFESLGENYNFS